jgi:hypothetical protein
LAQGLSVQRIHQDLVAGRQFVGSYFAVRRFVSRRVSSQELPFRRMECAPGHELQVDFGQGDWVSEAGKRRRLHLFRAVLSHSRKGYSEVVWRQTIESFIGCLENALRHFGGVAAAAVIDLKASVIRADWYDPELHPKLEEFAAGSLLPPIPVCESRSSLPYCGTCFMVNEEAALLDRRVTQVAPAALFSRRLRPTPPR